MSTASLIDIDNAFASGMRSDANPANLVTGQYWHAVNMLNRGGVLQVRPGYRCLMTLPDGNFQGFTLYHPKVGFEQMIVVIDGIVYVSEFPFQFFRMLPNVLLAAHAKQVYFAETEQSVRRLNSTLESGLEFIEPRKVLFIQDGGFTAPVWYDGSHADHIRDNELDTPLGGAMLWTGDRLWVAHGSYVYGSDIANPFSFREQVYLGGISALVFESEVIAIARIPSLDSGDMMVLTDRAGHQIRASIRTRSEWTTTTDFQKEIFNVGCSSARSVVAHCGMLWWFAPNVGLTNLDAAYASKHSLRLPSKDSEMAVSKHQLSQDLSMVAGTSFGPYVLMSVPSGDLYNSHTWVVDNASVETMNEATPATWNGYWTGTRPIEWVSGKVGPQERVFHVSKDYDGQNRLWESFTEDRLDNGCPITWFVETRGFMGPLSGVAQGATRYDPLRDKLFAFADIQFGELAGDVDVAVWWAGTSRGAYKRCATKRIRAGVGNIRWDQPITQDSILFGLKPQSRKVRTEDARKQDIQDGCPVERAVIEDLDESFQLLIAGSGPAAIRNIRVFAQPYSENPSGECGVDEVKENLVRFDGQAAQADKYGDAISTLAAGTPVFSSSQTVSLDHEGFSATGVGYAESLISQEDADKIATVIATRQAEVALQKAMPPMISDGEHYDENGL